MAKTLGVKQYMSFKSKALDFEGDFEKLIGKPECKGSWIVWGNPANGKTRFVIKLAKYLCRFEKVLYNPLEEGVSLSLQNAFNEEGIEEVDGRFIITPGEDIDELTERLSKRGSVKIIIIDSLQYTSLTYKRYKLLKAKFPNKLFIWVSHAEGKEPDGMVAKKVRYDSNCKIRVDGFVAFAQTRYGGNTPFIIWAEAARNHHGEGILNNEVMYQENYVDYEECSEK